MRRRKRLTMMVLAILCMVMVLPMSTNAAKLKKISVDKYLAKGKSYMILAYNASSTPVVVRQKATQKSSAVTTLTYGTAVTVDRSKLKKGVKTSWIPVFIYSGRSRTTCYVQATQVKLSTVNKTRFSSNSVINTAIQTGIKYLGTPFLMPGSSLSYGIDCASFANAIFSAAGRPLVSWAHTDNLQAVSYQIFYHTSNTALSKAELNALKPGDLLFYLKNDTYGPIDHVGVYIGNGFMINSSGHYGSTYPNGGICIKRVQYGNRKIVRAMRINGF
jgi:cell wall-associated NlpC family hydrolase